MGQPRDRDTRTGALTDRFHVLAAADTATVRIEPGATSTTHDQGLGIAGRGKRGSRLPTVDHSGRGSRSASSPGVGSSGAPDRTRVPVASSGLPSRTTRLAISTISGL